MGERGVVVFLVLWVFLLFAATFAFLIQVGMESAEAAETAASGFSTFWLVFCG
jgi:hypothetical protein